MIVSNSVICKKCGDVIYSRHRHDFVTCKCGNVAVDGGQEYLRRSYEQPESFIDISWELDTTIYNKCAEAAQEAMDTNRNAKGIANAVMRCLRGYNRIVADNEKIIMADNNELDEIMVDDLATGKVSRYKRIV
jgi:hypothetical protein